MCYRFSISKYISNFFWIKLFQAVLLNNILECFFRFFFQNIFFRNIFVFQNMILIFQYFKILFSESKNYIPDFIFQNIFFNCGFPIPE